MKILRHIIISFSLMSATATALCAATPVNNASNANSGGNFQQNTQTAKDASHPLTIGVVNFKECVEKSKFGKQEQTSFEALKKQMETVLAEKEKALNEMATKFEDPDYLDSLSPEAETELKRKFRLQTQELTQQQNQYYQALNQTNFKIVQKITDMVTEAAATVGKQRNIDIVLNDESCFYNTAALDISSQVVVVMDQMFEEAVKEAKNPKASEQKKS